MRIYFLINSLKPSLCLSTRLKPVYKTSHKRNQTSNIQCAIHPLKKYSFSLVSLSTKHILQNCSRIKNGIYSYNIVNPSCTMKL